MEKIETGFGGVWRVESRRFEGFWAVLDEIVREKV
jgi:hypothetical protein